jgi:putative zinc finger protein
MSCKDFETLIALYVEGDLSEPDRQRVESHLRPCWECWNLAEDLKESQAVLKSIRENVPSQAMLSSVRARVLDDVAGMQPGTWFERFLFGGFRQRATLAGIALLIAGSGVLWLMRKPEAPIASPRPVAVVPPSVVEPALQPASPAPAQKPRVRRRKPAPADPVIPEAQPQVTIRLLTDDPNVIIYWLGDEKGD